MDRNAAITVARALIEEMGIQPGELFPEPKDTAPAPDIDALLPRRRWVPKQGEKYWWSDSFGTSCPSEWDGGSTDRERAALGNVFPSCRDAKEHAANIRAWVEMRERSDAPDGMWGIGYTLNSDYIIPGVGFSSPEKRQAVVNLIGDDRIDALIRWIWNL